MKSKLEDIIIEEERYNFVLKECKNFLKAISREKFNDTTFEDLKQDAYLAFREVEEIHKKKPFENEKKYYAKLINIVRAMNCKNNVRSLDFSNKVNFENSKKKYEDLIVQTVLNKELDKEKKDTREIIEKLKKQFGEDFIRELVEHFEYYKNESLLLSKKTPQAYASKIKRRIEKIRKEFVY